ncbi:helix-turn-helix transcriptional regulator [Saccharopolyspora erythraea]|uniref:TetR/AcrR family transcriptional regulator n=1 Tax=Saccharopolyspora erythraea TaxID=1836 RepID=UPI001BA9CD34|nr:TetR/AcrR family transcriptional regulator [Saccharopolyspora erythraea]QUH03098.1 helix-turn-helix transcriptional regulator [Saccharopolyspora erythraea]
MTEAAERTRLRADARRNRDRIVSAARTVFAERGAEVPMEEIARAAEVGVGTLYRRFPDRDSLIRAVAVDTLQRVLDTTRAIVAREQDPWAALTEVVMSIADLRVVLQLSLLSPRARVVLTQDDDAHRIRNVLMGILDELVRAAQENGSMRTDVSGADIAVLLSLVLRGINGLPHDLKLAAPPRFLTLMLDGLRFGSTTPLPGRSVTQEDLDFIRTSDQE